MVNKMKKTNRKRKLTNHTIHYLLKAICLMITFQLASCSSPLPEWNNPLDIPTELPSFATVSPPLDPEPLPIQPTLQLATPPPTDLVLQTPTHPPITTPSQMPNDYPAFVINAYYPENAIIIFDSNGEIYHQIKMDDNLQNVDSISDGLQPCELMITSRTDNDIRFWRYQLRDQQSELFYQISQNDSETTIIDVALSPNEKWISYTALSGASYLDGSEFQDIEVISVADSENKYRLTSFGGALEPAAWSSDGEQLSFSDYDLAGKQQLIVVELKGLHRKIVQTFEGPNTRIAGISWSPNGEKIVYIVYRNYGLENSDFQPELWVADLKNGSNIQIELPIKAHFFHGAPDWSKNGNHLLVWFVSDKNMYGFFRVDLRTSSVEYAMDGRSLRNFNPPVTMEFPFIVSSDLRRIGFLNGNSLRIFDTGKERITGSEFSSLSDWLEPLTVTPLQQFYKDCW